MNLGDARLFAGRVAGDHAEHANKAVAWDVAQSEGVRLGEGRGAWQQRLHASALLSAPLYELPYATTRYRLHSPDEVRATTMSQSVA